MDFISANYIHPKRMRKFHCIIYCTMICFICIVTLYNIRKYWGRVLMNKSTKFSLFLAMTLVLSMFLAACAGGTADKEEGKTDKKDDGKASEEVADGGDLVIATLSDAALLDPQRSTDVPSANLQTNIFEGLVKKDK